jgi:hypothetical protein
MKLTRILNLSTILCKDKILPFSVFFWTATIPTTTLLTTATIIKFGGSVQNFISPSFMSVSRWTLKCNKPWSFGHYLILNIIPYGFLEFIIQVSESRLYLISYSHMLAKQISIICLIFIILIQETFKIQCSTLSVLGITQ